MYIINIGVLGWYIICRVNMWILQTTMRELLKHTPSDEVHSSTSNYNFGLLIYLSTKDQIQVH